MATRRNKLPSPGLGGGLVTKTLMKIGGALKNTPGALYRAITGGPREQTYGHIADLWSKKYKDRTRRSVTTPIVRSTSTATAIPPMPGMDTEEILDLMKRNFEQEKRYREVQKSFAEERAGEEQKRHEELIEALKKVTGGTATPVAGEKKEGGFLNNILEMFKAFEEKMKGMVEGIVNKVMNTIDFIKDSKLMFQLSKFLTSPIFGLLLGPLAMIGSILLLASFFKDLVALVPDYSKLTQEEARNVLETNDEKQIKKFGGREKLMQIAGMDKVTPEQAQTVLDTIPDLSEGERKYYQTIADFKPDTQTELRPVMSKDEYVKNSRKNKTAAAEFWDQTYGDRYNEDGTPKLKLAAKSLPQGVEPATASDRADYAATDPRRLDLPQGAAFGVRPMGIKAAPVPPPPPPVVELTDMNRDLEMYTSPMGDVGGLVVQQNNNSNTKKDSPLPATATQRDEEPMAAIIFRTQRRKAKAY